MVTDWSASAGLIRAEKMPRKKSHPMSAIEKGVTSQFTNRVTSKLRGWRPAVRMEAKSPFIIMGVLIS